MTNSAQTPSDEDLAEQIIATQGSTAPVETTLKTDSRVLARVTDGIYRQPGSALRELVSNAYDADASRVIIATDRPRFSRITIEDDGVGMSPHAVANLLHHIGGSAKRSSRGAELGLTSSDDSSLSPAGRPLIGKVGIGLFSVAQLTQNFQIITKTTADRWRTVASVVLKQYADVPKDDTDMQYEAGLVRIWQEPAEDAAAHGTTIVLDSLRPKTRDTLQSAGHWTRVETRAAEAPKYHIGRFRPTEAGELLLIGGRTRAVPWSPGDEPVVAFGKLVDSVWDELSLGDRNPRLDQLFDYYLQMVWQLSLSVPAPYLELHPFDTPLDSIDAYELPGSRPGPAKRIDSPAHSTVRESLGLPDVGSEGTNGFRVLIDDLELRRPLRFRNLPSTTNAVKTPMMFVGNVRETFPEVDPELSGGALSFQAYLFWAPKIAPVDHVGALIRIHGASGTLFDPTFLRYQVSELTRLRQISCEVFVSEGFEAALNIDRESFNFAHPHVVRLTAWLHQALTRSITQQKQVAAFARSSVRTAASDAEAEAIAEIVRDLWRRVAGEADDIPDVMLSDVADAIADPGSYVFRRSRVLGDHAHSRSQASRTVERKLIAIVQVLAAYELLDLLEPGDREELVISIGKLLGISS